MVDFNPLASERRDAITPELDAEIRISIHSPLRGETIRAKNAAARYLFQSTRL